MTSVSTDSNSTGEQITRQDSGRNSILNLSQPKGWKEHLKTLIPSLMVSKINEIAAIGIGAMEDFEWHNEISIQSWSISNLTNVQKISVLASYIAKYGFKEGVTLREIKREIDKKDVAPNSPKITCKTKWTVKEVPSFDGTPMKWLRSYK